MWGQRLHLQFTKEGIESPAGSLQIHLPKDRLAGYSDRLVKDLTRETVLLVCNSFQSLMETENPSVMRATTNLDAKNLPPEGNSISSYR